jgi:hypothetical protein
MSRDPMWWAAMTREAIALAIAASTGIVIWLRKRRSRHWPTTLGNVESASSFEDSWLWRTDVAYSYSIDHEFYPGEFHLRSRSERKSNEKELRWRGRKVAVRYSPLNPQMSVVRIEDQAGLYREEYAGPGFPS